ncbi:S-adenosylmethionine synthase [uncultured archaeon]|nr:S-adenosylmethionine synthase [uncultured archaeon]
MIKRLFTSESVTEGHPDKVADQISDALLDAFMKEDKYSRVAIETAVTTGLVFVEGEVTSKGYVDIPGVIRNTVREIGYTNPEYEFDYKSCGVMVAIHEQSPDIAQGVLQGKDPDQNLGAGDQGMMFGYACNETPELMPLPITLAHALTNKFSDLRKSKKLTWARPDGKSQVTVEYHNGKPVRIDTVVMSVQHDDIPIEKVRMEVMEHVIKPVLGVLIDTKTKFHINPTGRFVIGGPTGDCGVTGRKIIVDTYGGMAPHGGGAFSGKDCTKVDRSACYAARYIAKNLVAAGIAPEVEVQLSYAIGVKEPVSIYVDAFGKSKFDNNKLEDLVRKHFPLSPAQIIKHFDLRRPIYFKTASFGHFGRSEFPWEKTDKVQAIKKELGLK